MMGRHLWKQSECYKEVWQLLAENKLEEAARVIKKKRFNIPRKLTVRNVRFESDGINYDLCENPLRDTIDLIDEVLA